MKVKVEPPSVPAEQFLSREAGRACLGRKEPPFPRNALQSVNAPISESDPRAHNQILDRARHEHLAGVGLAQNPGPDVDGNAADLVADPLALSSVDRRSDPHAQRTDGVPNRQRAANGPGRAIKCRKKSVTGGVDLASAIELELLSYRRMVAVEKIAPATILGVTTALVGQTS